jgi:hypothetical protein
MAVVPVNLASFRRGASAKLPGSLASFGAGAFGETRCLGLPERALPGRRVASFGAGAKAEG